MEINIAEIHAHLEQESQLKENLRDGIGELEKKTRSMTGTLNKIHFTPTRQVPLLLQNIKPILAACGGDIDRIVQLVPPNQFWRWKDLWTRHIQSIVFVAVLVEYLDTGGLISLPDVNRLLEIQDEWKDRFYIQVEDYLHGLISVVNELSRLAVNTVTMGDYDAPSRINTFVKEVFAGFSLLNLKNDTLRRRFDSIKYDVRKIEEVVYDVSLRKLNNS